MQQTPERTFLRIGAVYAVLGSVVSVAAGTGFGNVTNELGTEAVLRYVSSQPAWYWPTVYLAFILGALLWVGALVALSGSLTQGVGWALARLGVASVVVGATVHVVDSSVRGVGLARLADAWAAASEQASSLRNPARGRYAPVDSGRYVGGRAGSLPRRPRRHHRSDRRPDRRRSGRCAAQVRQLRHRTGPAYRHSCQPAHGHRVARGGLARWPRSHSESNNQSRTRGRDRQEVRRETRNSAQQLR